MFFYKNMLHGDLLSSCGVAIIIRQKCLSNKSQLENASQTQLINQGSKYQIFFGVCLRNNKSLRWSATGHRCPRVNSRFANSFFAARMTNLVLRCKKRIAIRSYVVERMGDVLLTNNDIHCNFLILQLYSDYLTIQMNSY